MRKRFRRTDLPEDPNQRMYQLVRKQTKSAPDNREPVPDEVHRIMSEMGRKGGKKGGKRRLITMSPEKRKEIALKAARARWAKSKA